MAGRLEANASRALSTPSPSGWRYIGVSGASGGRGGRVADSSEPSAVSQAVVLASVKSWSSPAIQKIGTTGRPQRRSSTRASAAVDSALWTV